MAITALPTLNQSASTFRDDADLYFNTELPQFSIELDNGWSEMNASTVLAQQEAQFAINQVTLTQNEALLATQQAQAAALSAGSVSVPVWVSGTTYAVGVSRYSPLNSQVYRRIIAGAGTTDPSLDKVNWTVVNSIPNQNVVLPVNNLPSVRPSLNLDFANSQTVDPRITFTRASTATRTNSKGLIEVVSSGTPRIDYDPISLACKGLLIEEQRTNLLTYSEAFDNAAWVKTNTTISSNASAAPDGALTSDKLIEDTANASHFVRQSAVGVVSTLYTSTVYLKAGERTSAVLVHFDGASFYGVSANLSTGALSFPPVDLGILDASSSASIQAAGSGWYRVSITRTQVTSTTLQTRVSLQNGATGIYTGDGTSGLFICGAQLEAGAFPTTYQPSTETFTGRTSIGTYYGSNGLLQTALSGVARLNYNPMNLTVQPKLLLEAAATNLLTYSERLDNTAWTKSNATVTANAVVAPDGATAAEKLVETATESSHLLRQSVSLNALTTYTSSIYAKAGERSIFTMLLLADNTAMVAGHFDLVAGTTSFGTNSMSGSTRIESVGAGWYRCSVVGTTGSTFTTPYVDYRLSDGAPGVAGDSYTGDGTSGLYIWGAQLEAGAFPTSYIPTVASAVTRVADTSTSAQTTRAADVASMTGINFSTWYRQDEGSFVVGGVTNRPYAAGNGGQLLSFAADSANRGFISQGSTVNAGFLQVDSGGVNQVGLSFGAPGTQSMSTSAAISYKTNYFAAAFNGSSVVTDTAGVLPNVSLLQIGGSITGSSAGNWNGHLRSISYYPERLSNVELQALSRQ